MGKWKYPQLLVLVLALVLAVLFCLDVTRAPESVEIYKGDFGPWHLRLAAGERVAPGETLVLTAWISSPGARPNYRRLEVSVTSSQQSQPTNMVGSGLARSGRLRLPPGEAGGTQLLLRAELWDGTSVTKKIPLAAMPESVAR